VLARLAAAWPVDNWRDVTTLVAVSGGADSTALLRGLAALREPGEGRLVVAHFNHHLRGEESDVDEAFVRELADTLGLGIEVGHAARLSGTIVRQTEASRLLSEEAARDARYAFFAEAARAWGARYIVTAHTADDQAETVLHRIFRGTGLVGLAGISQVRPLTEMTTIVRPLLGITRTEALEYLHSLGQSFCIDSSNARGDFTRNRIRNELLPWAEAHVHPGARESILRLSEQAEEYARHVRGEAKELLARCVTHRSQLEVLLDAAPLLGAAPLIVRQMFVEVWRDQGWPEQAMGAAEWKRLAEWAQSDAGSTPTLPSGIRAIRKAGKITLAGPITALLRT
jgi:tRNA(Ile)-lysidine synthase